MMKINLFSIKAKLVLVIFLCMTISALVILTILNSSYEANIKIISEHTLIEAKRAFDNLEKNNIERLSAVTELIMLNEDIKKIFLEKDRDKLYQFTRPIFNKLKEHYGITHWYFHNPEPEGTVFLRVHRPWQYGDVIKRYTYLASVKTKKFSFGKELGKSAFALRVVHPYYDNGNLIGYIELGEDIGHFLKVIKEDTGNEYGLFILKKYLNEKEWALLRAAKGMPNNWPDFQGAVLVDRTTADENITNFAGDLERIPESGTILQAAKLKKSVYSRGVFPLYDAGKRRVGAVFVAYNITPLYSSKKETTLFVILLFFPLTASIIVLLNKLFFARLEKITNTITRVVGGDFHTKIIPSANDELGKVESLLEQFRQIFINTLSELEKKIKK